MKAMKSLLLCCGLALTGTALAADEVNPFMTADVMTVESSESGKKCGDGKCGEGKAKGKCGEGKCGEGKSKSKCGGA